jgi:creatinine amidohydrolase
MLAVVWQWWTAEPVTSLTREAFSSRGSHAGASETSIVWAIDESLVHSDRFEAAAAGASDVYGRMVHGSQLPLDTLDFSESGATLDPREADREAGSLILEKAVDELVSLIQWIGDANAHLLERPSRQPRMP